jgi:hypothetical protein
VTFLGLLTLLLIALKLTHFINWSWWWVLLPTYGTTVVAILFLVIGVATGGTLKITKRK